MSWWLRAALIAIVITGAAFVALSVIIGPPVDDAVIRECIVEGLPSGTTTDSSGVIRYPPAGDVDLDALVRDCYRKHGRRIPSPGLLRWMDRVDRAILGVVRGIVAQFRLDPAGG